VCDYSAATAAYVFGEFGDDPAAAQLLEVVTEAGAH
jgi:hypothetical protein